MGSVLEASILHHVGIVLIVLWLLASFNCCSPVAYCISFVYLFLVHERYVTRLGRILQFEERRNCYQRRVLSDSESVRWLNHAVEKMWTVCMEEIVSQKILLPIVPWFLEKYKPWTVKDAVVQQLYMGRSPPIFTEMRVLHQSNGDDHLVLELGMNFRTADDMSALLAVKLTKRLGFGMVAKLHLLGMHIEGKVLLGVKFVRKWPFIGRVRLCFVEPPYFQMTVKPIFTHGLDVTELPGIAGWLDKLLAVAFEQTLVEPNMLVVDVEKLASPTPENWFSVDEKEPVAHAVVEVLEAADMKPSDMNGLADPYVKGQLGPYRFRTKTQKKTLNPKWHEEFKVPICSWESPNTLTIEVRDKDRFVDDKLGECSISLNELRDSQRHDMWLPLQNIKVGRLHLAITVVEENGKGADQACEEENSDEYKRESFVTDTTNKGSFSSRTSEKSPRVADKYEPIDLEGQRVTGMWAFHPGSEVAQVWEPRKGKNRQLDTQIQGEGVDSAGSFKSKSSGFFKKDGSCADENVDTENTQSSNPLQRGFQRLGSMFHRRQKNEEKYRCTEGPIESPRINLKSVDSTEIGVKFIVDDTITALDSAPAKSPKPDGKESSEGSVLDSPNKDKVKDRAKNIFKQSARGIKHALTRKGSSKSKSESGESATERDVSVLSNSSDEESVQSSVCAAGTEAISVPSKPISSYGNNSFNSREQGIPSPSNNATPNIIVPIEKGSPEASKIQNHNVSGTFEKNGLVEESRSPKQPVTSVAGTK